MAYKDDIDTQEADEAFIRYMTGEEDYHIDRLTVTDLELKLAHEADNDLDELLGTYDN